MLSDAYELLEDWPHAIEYARADFGDSDHAGEWRLLELFEGARRWDDIESLVDRMRDQTYQIDAAFALINGGRLDKAYAVLMRELKAHPDSASTCAGLAMVHLKREEFAKADAMMERAIALRPRASGDRAFRCTLDYWLTRGQPEKARAWVRKSLELDAHLWKVYDLMEWVLRTPEFAEALEPLFESEDTN